ncbi:MAG TPA: dehydrogenase [Desulfomonilia bacterium]|nr:dehydrogenase [Desulfomonilia bacterium]
MKRIISISLGTSDRDYEITTKFLGQDFFIKRMGTDGDAGEIVELLYDWENHADVIGLAGIKFPSKIGLQRKTAKRDVRIKELSKELKIPVTTGEAFRNVAQEWVARYVQETQKNFFTNARVLVLSGMNDYSVAAVINGYTDNVQFADPVFDHGIPKFINSLKDMELYAKGVHDMLSLSPAKVISTSLPLVNEWNKYILRKAMQKATVIVVPYEGFYDYLAKCTPEELGGKIIITSTAYQDRVEFLKKRGVDVIVDSTPQILERMVQVDVLEAMIIAALDKKEDELTNDDLLEVISEQGIYPRILYPSGKTRRVNRFTFVIHPLSQEYLKKDKAVELISKIAPPVAMDAVEKIIAYAPPFVYSKVTGIKSPTGVEAEGWLITVGGTPKQMLSHPPEFTYKRLLEAAAMSKRMGAQIMGLGAFTKVVGDAGVTVAKLADIPITTGNSYSASGALWAAADAVRRMGLIKIEEGKKIKAKTMVIGATGAIGSVCCRLLALAFESVYMVDIRDARLLSLKDSIMQETPDVDLHISTRADKFIGDMDVIVTATSAAGKKILDIRKVKPGCVITDVARPLDLSREDVAKRPDVLYIESGEILLPGEPKFKEIGLPPKVAFACLAETIVLALEGRFEVFTIGREIEWQKVKEIYKMGLKHGMKLAAISGVNGVYSDQDIRKVVKLALKERAKGKKGTAKPPLKKVVKKGAAPLKKASGTAKADVKKAPAKKRRPAGAPRESTL